MPKRAAAISGPAIAVAFIALALCGCAKILGIVDVPAGTAADGKAESTPPTTGPDNPALDTDGSTDVTCAYVDAGNPPVLCGGENVRCKDSTACCFSTGACVVCSPSGGDPWSCESHEQCLGRPPFGINSGPCCATLQVVGGLTCPRETQSLFAKNEPTSACIVDVGPPDAAASCGDGMTLCRDDAECTPPAVCTKVHVSGTSVNGVVGACVAP